MAFSIRLLTLVILLLGTASIQANAGPAKPYLIQPGDILLISVWKEDNLNREVVVRPDGMISFPLIGEAGAGGKTVDALREEISARLKQYIPEPVVTVSVRQLAGNKIYVLGKVNRPGEFPIVRDVDVMQALSIAGGTSTYAALNKIKILRRKNGKLTAIPFRYGEVEKGENLDQNIILEPGDVVVVP